MSLNVKNSKSDKMAESSTLQPKSISSKSAQIATVKFLTKMRAIMRMLMTKMLMMIMPMMKIMIMFSKFTLIAGRVHI